MKSKSLITFLVLLPFLASCDSTSKVTDLDGKAMCDATCPVEVDTTSPNYIPQASPEENERAIEEIAGYIARGEMKISDDIILSDKMKHKIDSIRKAENIVVED